MENPIAIRTIIKSLLVGISNHERLYKQLLRVKENIEEVILVENNRIALSQSYVNLDIKIKSENIDKFYDLYQKDTIILETTEDWYLVITLLENSIEIHTDAIGQMSRELYYLNKPELVEEIREELEVSSN